MHHTLDNYQSNYDEKEGIGPLAKKIKTRYINSNANESLLSNPKQSSNTFVVDVDTFAQNDNTKFTIVSKTQSSSLSSTIPNRKRRYRNIQDICVVNTSIPCSTTNLNGHMRKKSDLSCVVCCAVAHGYNFDAISCESCKAFFRRNALSNTDRLKCRREQACEITLETRRRCKSCRLKKCFAVGMRKEWILTEEEKVNKKRRIEENRKLRVPSIHDIRSSKDSLEKNDLDLQNVLFNKNEKSSLKHQSTSHTKSSDIITNVVLAYNDSIKLDVPSYGWSYPLARKITALCQIIHARNTTALRLINFYKSLHCFDILNETDKMNLIKNNLQYVLFFHSSLKYDPVHDAYHEENTNDKPLYGVDIREAYGNDNYKRLVKVMCALNSIVQIDKRLMQVALVIFLFSKGMSATTDSNELSIDNHKQIFHLQNTYTEHLWVFIEKLYGHVQATLIFSTLISNCLLIQGLLRDIQHDVYEKLDPSEVPPILRSIFQSA
ncbi:unnamed protein product [Adineta steineri]|uniref:Nuclear receptor domain-containing protein n=1 Tax=Adineta steineri TaxID=433720 RepID=A0A818TEW2_9BILA|nr:unnamed protein product [Adineta steineri]CAF1357591.1 unnamed protein product [Adineta steineri]CAF3552135.1 unnamed protein product [Adineta steineri]CAF3683856.1 unnamed protein product [Adineta steineri]